MNKKLRWLIVLAAVVAAGLFVAFKFNSAPRDQHFTARVERGDIHDVVDATGTINAVITVQVGSQVSGTISKLFVDFNSRVRKGDVVALIDPALFQGAVLQASADLDSAKANLEAAKANLEKARSTAVQTKADYDRALQLTKENITSKQQLDLAKANYDSANAQVGAAAASVTQSQAQVHQKDAALSVARTNLNYTVIRSPIDGTVVARNVDVGQTVAASLQAPTVFTIAQDLTKMLVYTKTDESDVGSIRPGKVVTFKVDAFPKEVFHGTVSQVRMNPTTVQNVVTYDTMIAFDNPELKLFPGMTAYVTIPVANVQNVLKLPNTALRYRPPMDPEEVLRIYKRYGIEEKQAAPSAVEAAPAGVESNRLRAPKTNNAVVWKLLPDNTLEPVSVVLGITDHAFTEIISVQKNELKEGDSLVIRTVSAKTAGPGTLRR
jgi:HlyD family secretion protein